MGSPNNPKSIQLFPVGYVQAGDDGFAVQILEPFRPALKQLEHFSHVIVLWWADQNDNQPARTILQTEPPYAEGKTTGVFACRAEYRPNPIGITTAPILGVDEVQGIVRLAYLDAYDGTPVVDLKAYFPVSDRAREARLPEWLSDWPMWLEDAYQLAF